MERSRISPRGAILAFAVVTSLVLAACGSAPAQNTAQGRRKQPSSADLVKFAACMRAHGLPNFPDPTPATNQSPSGPGRHVVIGFGNEQFVLNNTNPQSAQFKSAMSACHNLVGIPLGTSHVTLTAQQKQAWVATAACMRQSGYPTFPDPKFNSNPSPPPQGGSSGGRSAVIEINGALFELGSTIDPGSPQFKAAFSACRNKAGVAEIAPPGGSGSK